MKILLVNDDGILAEGINILAAELVKNHDVYVCAPSGERSGMSQALSVGIPLCVKQERLPVPVKKAFSVDGKPADCTKLALEVLLKDEHMDMVISGINRGANLGTDVLYSGTVGAALEGYNHKVRSLAVSVSGKSQLSFAQIAEITAGRLEYFYSTDELFMYNINFPIELNSGKIEFVFTKQGFRRYENEFDTVILPDGTVAYKMQGRAQDIGNDEFTDIAAVKRGCISVTPLTLERTDFAKLNKLNSLK